MNASIDDEQLNRLIPQIYDAALNDALWPSVINRIGQAVNARDSMFFSPPLIGIDNQPFQLSPLTHANADDIWATYTSHYWQHDVWAIEIFKRGLSQTGTIIHGDQLMERQLFRQTEMYRDYIEPNWGIEVIMCTVLYDGSTLEQSPQMLLSYFNPPAAEAFSQQDERLMRYLLPHLQRALCIRWKLANEQLNCRWRELALDEIAAAVILLDAAGKAVFVNRQTEALLRAGGNPALRNGCLCGRDSGANAAITQALRQAKDGIGSTLRFCNPYPIGTRIATFSPLSPAQSEHLGTPTRILVMMTEPEQPALNNIDAFAKLYRLTGAEARVLTQLLQQHSTAEIAETLHVSINTLRTQLKALFAKTDTKSQKELVRFYFSHPINGVAARQATESPT